MPAPSLLDLFRTLSNFAPTRVSLRGAPWEEYVDWAIVNGLAPLAAYNLEYRLAGGGAPEWARDRLLSVYQGSVNDNVMKLVAFKRSVDELEGRRVLLLGAASFAESLYPHVAFRPVPEVRLRVDANEVRPFANFLGEAGFQPLEGAEGAEGADQVLSDGHVPVLIFKDLLGSRRADEERDLLARAMPMKVYGPSIFRPALEDALLLHCLELARAGFDVPMISFVDLRELVLGSPMMSGDYSRPLDPAAVKERAHAWKLDRALYASLSVLIRLYPETEAIARAAMPELRGATRALLERSIVEPISSLGRVRVARGLDRFRRLLAGA